MKYLLGFGSPRALDDGFATARALLRLSGTLLADIPFAFAFTFAFAYAFAALSSGASRIAMAVVASAVVASPAAA